MKLSSLQNMLKEYDVKELDFDDNLNRNQLLVSKPYSVIFETSFLELDSLNKWIEINLDKNMLEWLFYGKIDYDYGFTEYFSKNESEIKALKMVIPNIYTIYTNSYPQNQIYKTNGCNNWIEYSKNEINAIII